MICFFPSAVYFASDLPHPEDKTVRSVRTSSMHRLFLILYFLISTPMSVFGQLFKSNAHGIFKKCHLDFSVLYRFAIFDQIPSCLRFSFISATIFSPSDTGSTSTTMEECSVSFVPSFKNSMTFEEPWIGASTQW